MTNKMTISDRINAMAFDSLTEDDFQFLVERALKSVRPAAKGPRKPTKAQIANAELADQIAAYVAEHEAVTCAELEEAFGLSNQKISAILNRSGKFVKATEAKGKVKATYTVAQSYMKIGDEVFIHGYVDEIRKDVVIIRNEGGYFGTVKEEIVCPQDEQLEKIKKI